MRFVFYSTPPVSILKPVHGLDPGFSRALASHVALEGEFEILCGVSDLNDPTVAVLRKFPSVCVIECRTKTPNGKVGVLMDLVAAARYPILVINDADIHVEPDYLARVTAPLADPQVGLITCLYCPSGDTLAARFEGLGISTDFAPSTLVAAWPVLMSSHSDRRWLSAALIWSAPEDLHPSPITSRTITS